MPLKIGVPRETAAGEKRVATVPDDALIETMRFFVERMKLVVEPTGCLALAAVRKLAATEPERVYGRRIGVIVSGGNVDPERFTELLRTFPAADLPTVVS